MPSPPQNAHGLSKAATSKITAENFNYNDAIAYLNVRQLQNLQDNMNTFPRVKPSELTQKIPIYDPAREL